MKSKSIIAISGRIGSGKSYAANLIKNEFGLPVASFGAYLKFYCEQKGLPTDRKTLQDMGETFVKTNPKQFLIDTLSHFIGTQDKIVLEGVRHQAIFNEILLLASTQLTIFISADLNTRYERYLNRIKDSDEIKSFEQFKIADNHPVELEIESLKPFCDCILDNSISPFPINILRKEIGLLLK